MILVDAVTAVTLVRPTHSRWIGDPHIVGYAAISK